MHKSLSVLPLASLLAMISTTGCISVVSPQTANTLEPGDTSGYAAITHPVAFKQVKAQKDEGNKSDDNDDSSDGDTLEAFWIDVGTRYGLAKSWDLGIERTGIISHIDIKHQFIDSNALSLAAGGGVGSNNLAGFINSHKANFYIRTSDLPLYVSTKVGASSNLYSVLRYQYTHIQSRSAHSITTLASDSNATSTTTKDGEATIVSSRNLVLSLGGIFGEPVGFFFELAVIKGMDKDGDGTGYQLALGSTFGNQGHVAKKKKKAKDRDKDKDKDKDKADL